MAFSAHRESLCSSVDRASARCLGRHRFNYVYVTLFGGITECRNGTSLLAVCFYLLVRTILHVALNKN